MINRKLIYLDVYYDGRSIKVERVEPRSEFPPERFGAERLMRESGHKVAVDDWGTLWRIDVSATAANVSDTLKETQ